MTQTRLPEIIGSALKAAREKRGMERGELATQCCLSSKMILELEEGGNSSFYNFQLKLSTAKRVGTFLGLAPTDYLEQPAAIVETVTPVSEVENSSDANDAQASQDSVSVKDDAKPAEVSTPSKPVVDEGEQLDDLIYESTHSGTSLPYVAARSTSFAAKRLGLVLGLLVVVGALYGVESKFQVSSAALAFIDSFGAKKVEQQESPGESASQEPQQAVAEDSASEKVPAKPELVANATPAQIQCPQVRDDQLPIYKSPNPSKLGDSVNIKTLVKQSICVADGQGKNTSVDLEPNTAHSFRGVSPFVVSAQDLDNVEMYYQGWRVRPPNAGVKQMKLVETAVQ